MAIILPSEKTKVNRDFRAQKFGMIGAAGIGKSAFWAQDPTALFLETESGLNALEVYKVAIRSWGDVRDTYLALKDLVSNEKFGYSVIIIDTIDRLVDYAQEETLGRAREYYKKIEINTIADIPNGAGWFKTTEMVGSFLNKLELLPCAIAYIGHLSIKHIKDAVGDYDKATISIGGKLGEDLLAWTDHTLHIESHLIGERLARKVWTKPTQSREAKSRGEVIPNGWQWGEDMKTNYEYFRKLFI